MSVHRGRHRATWCLAALLTVGCRADPPSTEPSPTTDVTTTGVTTTVRWGERSRTGVAVPAGVLDLLRPDETVDSLVLAPARGWLVSVLARDRPCAPTLEVFAGSTRTLIGAGFSPSVDAGGARAVFSVPDPGLSPASDRCSARALAVIDLRTMQVVARAAVDGPGPLRVARFATSDPLVLVSVTAFDRVTSAGGVQVWAYDVQGATPRMVPEDEQAIAALNARAGTPAGTVWRSLCIVDEGDHRYLVRFRSDPASGGPVVVDLRFDPAALVLDPTPVPASWWTCT